MAAVDEHGELDAGRPAEVREGIHRGADAASGVEHVVHQDDAPAVDVNRHLRALEAGAEFERGNVVAVETDIELANGHGIAFELAYRLCEALGERYAARVHADESDGRKAPIAFDDLVGDTADGPTDVLGRKDDVGVHVCRLGSREENALTHVREGIVEYRSMRLLTLSEAAIRRSLAASPDRLKG